MQPGIVTLSTNNLNTRLPRQHFDNSEPNWSIIGIEETSSQETTTTTYLSQSNHNAMASQEQKPRLAWIGLGNMGRGMVKNLVEKGDFTSPLAIYNRTTARSEKLAEALPSDKVKV